MVARDCIGKLLVHRTPEGETAGRIVETEAYRGPHDLAAHSSRGLTKRTAAMFGPPGRAYVYRFTELWALNIVYASEGYATCSTDSGDRTVTRNRTDGARRRGQRSLRANSTNGPGKLTEALASPAPIMLAICAATNFFLRR